jgi:hypothetical protein
LCIISSAEEIDWGQEDLPVFSDDSSHKQNRRSRSSRLPVSVILPVDEEDYLRPGATAPSLAYLDLDGNGYYKNEKETFTDDEDPFSNEMEHMLDQIIDVPIVPAHKTNGSKHHYINNSYPAKVAATRSAVANPDYFEEISEAKKKTNTHHNGYIQVPSMSPVHLNNNTAFKPSYPNLKSSHSPSSHPSQTVNTDSNVPGLPMARYEAKV